MSSSLPEGLHPVKPTGTRMVVEKNGDAYVVKIPTHGFSGAFGLLVVVGVCGVLFYNIQILEPKYAGYCIGIASFSLTSAIAALINGSIAVTITFDKASLVVQRSFWGIKWRKEISTEEVLEIKHETKIRHVVGIEFKKERVAVIGFDDDEIRFAPNLTDDERYWLVEELNFIWQEVLEGRVPGNTYRRRPRF